MRAHAGSVLLAAIAAGIAYVIAGLLVGLDNAIFAPIAAVVATGLTAGQRIRRATEISTGVVLGIVAADLLSRLLGVGVLQLSVAVLIAMTAAVAVRASALLANQAAVAAVVVVALVPHMDTGPWIRLSDALIGGAVAVALNAVVAPDPYRAARVTTTQILDRFAGVLGHLSTAVRDGSLDESESALAEMTSLDSARSEIDDALDAARERFALNRTRRQHRDESLRAIEGVADRLVIMVATGRALARTSANLVRHEVEPEQTGYQSYQDVKTCLSAALDELQEAVGAVQKWLTGDSEPESVRELALKAAVTGSTLAPRTHASVMLNGQIRSATVDLLRITGLSQRDAVAEVERAAGRSDQDEF